MEGLGHSVGTPAGDSSGCVGGTHDDRRNDHVQLIDKAAVEEAAEQNAAAFEESCDDIPCCQLAQKRVRWRCDHSRASGPDTQRESPDAAAIRPSSEAANLATTKGRPVSRCLKNASLIRLASASPSPLRTRMPAASSTAWPPPLFSPGSATA